MRTTVDLPDELFRKAKAHAALEGRSLKDVVADGLKIVLQIPNDSHGPTRPRRIQFPIVKAKNHARKLTAEMVAAAEDQLTTKEAAEHARLAGH